MKKIFFLILISCNTAVFSQTVKVNGGTVYTTAATTTLISESSKKDQAFAKNYADSLQKLNAAAMELFKKQCLELISSRPKDTLVPGIGMRFDSLSTNKTKLNPQVYWDPVTNQPKRNW